MAVDDTVSALSSVNTVLTYQPAAGVEVVVTSVAINDSTATARLYDGTNTGFFRGNTTGITYPYSNMKLFITNTLYLYIDATGAATYGAFTGIQIK